MEILSFSAIRQISWGFKATPDDLRFAVLVPAAGSVIAGTVAAVNAESCEIVVTADKEFAKTCQDICQEVWRNNPQLQRCWLAIGTEDATQIDAVPCPLFVGNSTILVLNKKYGSPEWLPFDLKTHRFPIS